MIIRKLNILINKVDKVLEWSIRWSVLSSYTKNLSISKNQRKRDHTVTKCNLPSLNPIAEVKLKKNSYIFIIMGISIQ